MERLPRCGHCGLPFASERCLVCEPPEVERWLIGRTLTQHGPLTSHVALGIGDQGRIVAHGVVDALRDLEHLDDFMDRNRRLAAVHCEHLGEVEVATLDGLPYRVCRTPREPTVADLARGSALSEDLVRGIAVALLEGLVALHGAGLVHGDLGVDTVHVGMHGGEARATLVLPAPLVPRADAASDLAALSWVLTRLLKERPSAAWRHEQGIRRLIVGLFDPTMPTSARRALDTLREGRPTRKRGLRQLLGGLVG